jgi:D-serine deaminase-like pyridoxal phosphate-dependent protein
MGPLMNKLSHHRNWIGRTVEELPTPAIVADADAIQKNLTLLSEYFNDTPCQLRPHFKSHKCVKLAQQQIACDNTTGITCAKVSEAEKLVSGGIMDVLIANQVIGRDKVSRVADLNRRAMVRVAVDSPEGIEQLRVAAQEAGVTIGVLVEVDIGMNRGGAQPGKPVIDLVENIFRSPGVRFDGLQGYEGHIVTLEDYEERKQLVVQAMKPLLETRRALEKNGISMFVSAGGTGTYDITGNIEGIDELQCGSYALMDSFYKKIRSEFKNARYVIATVISTRGDTVTTDVGLKGMGAEYAMPEVMGHPKAEVLSIAEEHTVIQNIDINIGDKVRLIPPHGCTTNNLYSQMWIARNKIIEDVWPIEGRGCLE